MARIPPTATAKDSGAASRISTPHDSGQTWKNSLPHSLPTRLRRELDAQFGPEWTPYVALLREMRVAAKVRYDDDTTRTAALRRLAASDDVRHLLRAGDTEGARREALICLS